MERAGLRYMLVGSFSSNLYGVPRSTKDADFVVEFGDLTSTALKPFLDQDFIIEPQMSFETVTGTHRYILRHRKTAFTVELFQLRDDPYDKQRFARRRQELLTDKPVYVPTPEDVVVTKLRWSKRGARRKDVDDVRNVLAVTTPTNLDLAYIRHWCDQHGTRELFEQLLAEVQA
jgi:hypothetical protein